MRFKKIRHSPTSTNHSLNAHLLLETTSAVLHVHADRLERLMQLPSRGKIIRVNGVFPSR